MSLLLYEFCAQNGFVEDKGELFYDQILLKFLLFSWLKAENGNNQVIVNELFDIIWPKPSETDNETEKIGELSRITFEFFTQIFVDQPATVNCVMDLMDRYNKNSKHLFLKVHLAAINSLLNDLESCQLDLEVRNRSKVKMFALINHLAVYELSEISPSEEQVKNSYYESLALIQRCFKDICFRLNALWAHNLDELDENFGHVYASLLFDYNEDNERERESTAMTSKSQASLLNLFDRIHYEVDKQIIIAETFQDNSLIVLSLIKQFAARRRDLLWRRLFLYCYFENKLLLKSLIDECLIIISRAQFEHLNLVFSVKEFLNLKPLILLLGTFHFIHFLWRFFKFLCCIVYK